MMGFCGGDNQWSGEVDATRHKNQDGRSGGKTANHNWYKLIIYIYIYMNYIILVS